MKLFNFLLTFFAFVSIDAKLATFFDWQPQQIHIGYGGLFSCVLFFFVFISINPLCLHCNLSIFIESVREMVIVWSTMDKIPESMVEYFLDDQQYQAKGHSKLFVDGGNGKRQQYIHTVCVHLQFI